MKTNEFVQEDVLKGIDYVFNELWPRMAYNRKHYENCKNYVGTITTLMNSVNNVNDLIQCLSSLNLIGSTIASGLIYSMWRDKYVPFDKYTIEHAYRLGIIPNKDISNYYEKYCDSVVKYVKNSKSLNTIEDFVRESWKF